MTDPVEPEPTEPKPVTAEEIRAIRLKLVGEHGPELYIPPTGRTITNITRQSRRIE